MRRASTNLADEDLLAIEALINQMVAERLMTGGNAPALTAVRYGDASDREGEAPLPVADGSAVWTPGDVENRCDLIRTMSWSPDAIWWKSLEFLDAARPARNRDFGAIIPYLLFLSDISAEHAVESAHHNHREVVVRAPKLDYTFPSSIMSFTSCDRMARLADAYYSCNFDSQLNNGVFANVTGFRDFCRAPAKTRSWQARFLCFTALLHGPALIATELVDMLRARASEDVQKEKVPVLGDHSSSQEKVMDAEREALERHFEWRMSLLRDSLSTPEVSMLLAITPQGVRKRIERKEVLAIKHVGDYRFPRWQFDATAETGVVRGLAQVIRALTVEPISMAAWLIREQASLGDRSPLEVLKAGEIEAVVSEAASVGVT